MQSELERLNDQSGALHNTGLRRYDHREMCHKFPLRFEQMLASSKYGEFKKGKTVLSTAGSHYQSVQMIGCSRIQLDLKVCRVFQGWILRTSLSEQHAFRWQLS
jgi:hypothetical protein